jgi:hypothetical protein
VPYVGDPNGIGIEQKIYLKVELQTSKIKDIYDFLLIKKKRQLVNLRQKRLLMLMCDYNVHIRAEIRHF